MDSKTNSEFDILKHVKIQSNSRLEKATKETIESDIKYFLSTKAHSYLKSELKHPDSEMIIDVALSKTVPWGLFEWKFVFTIKNGRLPITYSTNKPFKDLDAVVSHAFQHLKEKLSWEKKNK